MDVDIDLRDRMELLSLIDHIPAAIHTGNKRTKHNSGIYFQEIPFDPTVGAASIDYREADARGYFKIDLLNVSAYESVRDEEHLTRLMAEQPVWELLTEEKICNRLAHVNGHHGLLARLKPASVVELAICLAVIRPAKQHLVRVIERAGWGAVEAEIWTRPANGTYYWKKSHAISYAMMVVVQLNALCDQLAAGEINLDDDLFTN